MSKFLFLLFIALASANPIAYAKPPKQPPPMDAGVPDAGSFDASGMSFRFCSNMFQTCTFTGTRVVRYGVPTLNVWIYRTETTSVPCTTTVFGEPANGWAKICQVQILPGDPVDGGTDAGTDAGSVSDAGEPEVDAGPIDPEDPTTFHYTYCSTMFQTCEFEGPKWVRFGFKAADEWNYLLIEDDSVLCSATVFGEPSNGNTKICETAPVP